MSAVFDKDDCRLPDMLCQVTDEIDFLGQNLLKEVSFQIKRNEISREDDGEVMAGMEETLTSKMIEV